MEERSHFECWFHYQGEIDLNQAKHIRSIIIVEKYENKLKIEAKIEENMHKKQNA